MLESAVYLTSSLPRGASTFSRGSRGAAPPVPPDAQDGTHCSVFGYAPEVLRHREVQHLRGAGTGQRSGRRGRPHRRARRLGKATRDRFEGARLAQPQRRRAAAPVGLDQGGAGRQGPGGTTLRRSMSWSTVMPRWFTLSRRGNMMICERSM